MDKKNSVAVLVNPATKHIEYQPLDEVKMNITGEETLTLRWFYNQIQELTSKVAELEKRVQEGQETQTQINNLLTNSVQLINEKLSIVETDIDTLNTLSETENKEN